MSSYIRSTNPATSPNRSVSPIQYVKPSSVYYSNTISPQKVSNPSALRKSAVGGRDVSPNAGQDEVGLWKSRCNDLETSLCQVNTDLELASFKAKKAKDLEGKVDDILKQNATLLGENDSLSKQFSQKRTESDIWKSKYDAQMNTIISLKSNHESEIRRLQSDLQNSRELYDVLQQERLKESQNSKQQIINDNITHVESLKRSHVSNVTLYEEQLRKTRDALAQREKDIEILQVKLNEAKNYGDSESNRLNEDKALLRSKITQMEIDHSKDMENQKRRCDALTLEQVTALKKLHQSELDILESELNKLKNLLDLKNAEIQQMIQQNKTQKRNFDAEIQVVRDENEALKDKILENNRLKEIEIDDIQNKLANLHKTDINNLKANHDNQQRLNAREVDQLKEIIAAKSQEIEQQLHEKGKHRGSYDTEVDRLNSELRTQQLKYEVLERDRQKDYDELTGSLNRANKAHADFSDQQRRQIAFLESEIEKLKQLLVHKNNEIDINLAQHRTIKANLEEDIRHLKLDNNDIRTRFDNIEHSKNQQIDELRNKTVNQDVQNQDKTKNFEAQINYLEHELKKTRESLQVKSDESNNNSVHRNLLDTENRKLNVEIDTLNSHLVLLERQKAQEIAELRLKLEQSNSYNIEAIKHSHDNQVDSMLNEMNDLKSIIDIKDRQLSEKADQYSQLERALTGMRDNSDLSEYSQRLSKLGAEVATTKNLYDVFVSTRQPTSGSKIMPNNSGVSPIRRVNQFN